MQIDRAVAAAVAAYRAAVVVPEGTRVLLARVYFDGDAAHQLAPPLNASNPPGYELGDEVGEPVVGESAELQAMLDAINYHEGDLLEEYFAALALALHDELGPIVLVSGLDVSFGAPVRDQIREQLTAAEWAQWEAADWLPRDRRVTARLAAADVLVSLTVGPFHTAVIHRTAEGIAGSSHFGRDGGHGRRIDGTFEQLGEYPLVVGGLLPAAAVSVRVRDLLETWHDGVVGGGAWLCALPHDAQPGRFPALEFRDAAGALVSPR